MEKMPNDVLDNVIESVKKAIYDEATKHEFKFNDHLSCDSNFYDAIKNYLISAGMFNPQTDELTISSPAKEPYRVDVVITKRLFEFDITIAPPDK